MTTPELSIVLAAWNRSELTRQCLASLQNCQLALEIILIDNGSEDDTVSMVQSQFPHVRILRNPRNKGVTTAWRQGFAVASAPLVCISNNDLVYEPGCLEALAKPLQIADWVGVTSPETYIEPDEKVPLFAETACLLRDHRNEPLRAGLRIGYTGWCFVFRKVDFQENFDPRLSLRYQDEDFLYSMLFKKRGLPPFRWPVPGKVPVVVPGARVEHAYHAGHAQLKLDWIKKQTEKDRVFLNEKWRGYQGNHYVGEIPWGQIIFLEPSRWQKVAGRANQPDYGTHDSLVSVVIPCYNRSTLLAETLESVVKQTYSPIEIIIVDDASTEPLLPVVEESLKTFEGAWQFVRLERNSGPGIARRVGSQLAQGKYIQYLDSDDIMHPQKISMQGAFLEAHPDMIMAYARSAYLKADHSAADSNDLLGRTGQTFSRILPDLLDRIMWTTSSCLWRLQASYPDLWQPLYSAEDMLFDFLNGLSDCPVEKTPGDAFLLYKRVHAASISFGIASDVKYQQEILKAYDYMWQALRESPQLERLRRRMAEMFAEKIMTFLVMRRYWEAQHCIKRIKEIDRAVLPLDVRVAAAFGKFVGMSRSFSLLRKWRWLVKLSRRKLTGK